METNPRRWLSYFVYVCLVLGVSAIGSSVIAVASQPATTAHAATETWTNRDIIMGLMGLVFTLVSAYFAGERRQIERMIAANKADIDRVDRRVDQHKLEADDIHEMLLTRYMNKDDVSEWLARLESTMASGLGALHRRLDNLHVPYQSPHYRVRPPETDDGA